jgi:hypothetical protein
MAEPIHLELLTDFFNKIDPYRPFAESRRYNAAREPAAILNRIGQQNLIAQPGAICQIEFRPIQVIKLRAEQSEDSSCTERGVHTCPDQPQAPFERSKVTVAVRTSLLSWQRAEKMRIFIPV